MAYVPPTIIKSKKEIPMKKRSLITASTVSVFILSSSAFAASENYKHVSDEVIAEQRHVLAKTTDDLGFGPQSPRDIDVIGGTNHRIFGAAPAHTEMNLCNIHFHKNAEHKGGEFTTYAGNGDSHGYGTGFKYNNLLTDAELATYKHKVGVTDHGDLVPGDTIEVHYVHTTAKVEPGSTLGSCLSKAISNPQLRVEAQIYVIVNDNNALDFVKLTHHEVVNGLHQAINIPENTGKPVQYAGSTTGPSYNKKGSPFQVTWSVRPQVAKVSISSIKTWLQGNTFDEDHAHGVRNLIINPDLLSAIK